MRHATGYEHTDAHCEVHMNKQIFDAQRAVLEKKESRLWDSSASAKNLADPIERPTAHPSFPKYPDTGWADEVPAKACLIDGPKRKP
jgi:hypothetical protein